MREEASNMSVAILFILLGMDFIHTVKADTYILPRVDELDQLLHGAIELSDNVLHCQHHT